MQKSGRGVQGENRASEYLEAEGYRIVERNFSSRFGEIDIIAEKGRYLCFVEVKTRGPRTIAQPAEFVTPAKQRKILLTANYYLTTKGRPFTRGHQPRFDCIEVYTDASGTPMRVHHIKNAF